MAILAQTAEHLVESEYGLLTVARYSDGQCIAFGRGAAKEFKRCLATHSPDRVTATFLRIGFQQGQQWSPLYKPHRMPGAELEESTQ